MKLLNIISLLFFIAMLNSSSFASPYTICMGGENELSDVKYTDYNPRYRKIPNDFLITKIEYCSKNTILHFRFVASVDKEAVTFFSDKHEKAWFVAPQNRINTDAESLKRNLIISNIRINDNKYKEQINASNNSVAIMPSKGDIITCELIFENMPHYIRSITLSSSETKNNQDRFACQDLQLKGQSSELLGTKDMMQTNIRNFYKAHKAIRYPSIIEVASLQQDSIFEKGAQQHAAAAQNNAISNAARPINYMPKMLEAVGDLNCHERFILQNVYFEEESADFTRRNQAVKTISIIVEHLQRFPDAKVALHGHTDIHGDQYNNLVLSEKRVLAVQRVLTERGIDRKRIIINFYGGKYPLPLYKDGGPMNRRVEAEIICSQANK